MAEECDRLKRTLSPIKVWSLALGCIIGWGAFVMPGAVFLPSAGPAGTAIGMGLAALVMIVMAFNYHHMIERFPMSGGEFAYACRLFGRRHGFVCGWFLSLAYLAIVPLNATALALVSRSLCGELFQFGFHYTVAGCKVYLGELILAQGSLMLFAWLSVRGAEFAGWVQNALVIALIGVVVVISGGSLLCSRASFSALAPAFPTGSNAGLSVFAIMAIAPWAFVGFETVPQAADEFKFPVAKTRLIMVCSILFGAVVYVVLDTVTAMVVPPGCTNWESYILNLGKCDGVMALPTFYAARELFGNLGLVLLGLAVLAAILSGIIGFYMASSRLLYAMATEGVLPKWFGRIHDRHRTPANAIWFIMALSMIAPFFGRTVLVWVVNMSAVGVAIGFAYTSVALSRLAVCEKNYQSLLLGVMGMICSAAFITLLLVPIKGLSCSLVVEEYCALMFWIALGVVFYIIGMRRSGRVLGLVR